MKLTTLLVLIGCLHISAASHSQTITFEAKGHSLREVFSAVRNQTGFKVVYNVRFLDKAKPVSISASKMELSEFLDKVLGKQGLTYEIRENTILIGRALQPQASVQAATEREAVQERVVSGKVSDESGAPLPGVTINIKGTATTTLTQANGTYRIVLPRPNTVLIFTMIGFEPVEQGIGNDNVVNVTLKASISGLDEVVVVGYGMQKKSDITGAVETVDLNTFGNRPLTNASAALQGLVSGAFISQTSGQPGNDDANILIRGIGTFNDNSPLVIIDGMPSELRDVNPRDIESVSVLKDAASAAIYGNRASNGVILITTKQGQAGLNKVSYSMNYGTQVVTRMPEVLKGVEYLEMRAEAHANSNGGIYPSWYNDRFMDNYRNNVDPVRYPTDFDWVGAVFRPAPILDNHVNISGGQKTFTYSASVGYLDQDGIAKGNGMNKLTIRTNFSALFLKDKLNVDLNLSGYEQRKHDLVDGMENAIYFAYVAPSTTQMYLPGYGYSSYGYLWAMDEGGGYRDTRNSPRAVRMVANYEPIKDLVFNASYNLMQRSDEFEVWKPTVVTHAINDAGEVQKGTTLFSSLENIGYSGLDKTFDARVSYKRSWFGALETMVMTGMEARETFSKSISVSRSNFSANVPNLSIGDPSTQKNGSSVVDAKWLSYFGRLNLAWDRKYLFEATIRNDGSSRFLDKWGVFPSASAGWRISEEAFLKGHTLIDDLKIRVSWGRLGNEKIGQYYAASDELSLNLFANFNNILVPAGATTKLANRSTTWETSEQWNAGMDFGLWKSRFWGSVDVFKKTNSDILMLLPISSTLGMPTTPYQNAAGMRNTGVEISLGYTGAINKLSYRARILASHTVSMVENLAGRNDIIDGNTILRVGQVYNSFYGLKSEGIYQTTQEINDHLKMIDESGQSANPYMGFSPVPGDIRFKDSNGDGVISNDDRVLLGKPYPDWVYSGTIDFNWRNWDFGLFFQGVQGVNSLNQGMITAPFHGGEAATGVWYRDAWTPERPSTTIQRIYSDPNRFNIMSSYYLEDASYVRLKNLTVGYTFPTHLIERIHLGNLRVFGNIQNAFTWSKMRYGFDPEKPSTTTSTLQYPQTRILTLGLHLNF